ncbi:endonuclease/exonuclease/phosphatase family protein [Sphaerotilus mobilis]|uniref:Endonuclease/exonuclease/phosphatase (EEP) superfamily protein YafD n=1 Tax=Sphaerotilus mobilis TaxID=47994 RepID=A0A4Q7LH05_9BURK|nr:endonuclease/exonuclease/phosphatase family protein [Sphaerotilus mobilis]RZS53303.1 endonuclease/exonuclease/phosphatase (EEP) superfamily protein YafD [Sphaerotilus mobilis]
MPSRRRTPLDARAARDARLAQVGSHPLQSLSRFVISLTVLVIGGLWAVLALADPLAWWAELLRYTPYLLLLVPALLALALSIAVGWAWRAAALAAVLVVVFPIMGWTHGQPENGSTRLRVMSFNIKSYKADDRPEGYDAIVGEIRRHDPDVLVMQDAQKLTDKWLPMPLVMKELLTPRHTQMHGQYVIASKHPLRNCKVAPLSADPALGDYLRCTVEVEGQRLEIVNVHLLSPREGLVATRRERLGGLDDWRINFGHRLGQARHLAEDLARQRATGANKRPLPLLIAGDLNAPEASPVVQTLLALGLRDAWSSAATGWGYTHGHSLRPHLSFLRIDHVLVSPTLGLAEVAVGGDEASEHRPVIVDLWLNRN